MDKRLFHRFLNDLKDANPNSVHIIESIQDKFEESFESITDSQIKALKTFPLQFVKRIPTEDGEWTTQLHIWAEQAVPEILRLDPMILAHKNSSGDTILMSLLVGALGAYTEVVNYELIEKILNTNLEFEDIKKVDEDPELVNVLDIKDLKDQTPIDFLINYAYATGEYVGQDRDDELIDIIERFSNSLDGSDVDDVVYGKFEVESDKTTEEVDESNKTDINNDEKEELL